VHRRIGGKPNVRDLDLSCAGRVRHVHEVVRGWDVVPGVCVWTCTRTRRRFRYPPVSSFTNHRIGVKMSIRAASSAQRRHCNHDSVKQRPMPGNSAALALGNAAARSAPYIRSSIGKARRRGPPRAWVGPAIRRASRREVNLSVVDLAIRAWPRRLDSRASPKAARMPVVHPRSSPRLRRKSRIVHPGAPAYRPRSPTL
jgi:hypothetical protein